MTARETQTAPARTAAALRVLIVDDEKLARMRLVALLNELAPALPLVVAGEAADAQQAHRWLAENACDVVLLDVQMPGRDGMSFAGELRRMPSMPAIVFVTAHPEHAVRAFEVEAVDYLTKPVRADRLCASLQRVLQRRSASGTETMDEALVVNERGRVTRVPVRDVLYLKAELKYVTMRTATRTYLLDDALSDLEQRVGARFIRVHRNALVARSAVRALERHAAGDDSEGEGWAVLVAPVGEWIAVSRRQVAAVREALQDARL